MQGVIGTGQNALPTEVRPPGLRFMQMNNSLFIQHNIHQRKNILYRNEINEIKVIIFEV